MKITLRVVRSAKLFFPLFRFPRVEVARHDKSWQDAMSVKDLESIRSDSSGKLFKRQAEGDVEDQEGGSSQKKRRKNLAPSQKSGPEVKYRSAKEEKLETISHSLDGKVVVVEPSEDKGRLERIVLKHGGKVEQNVKEGVTHCFVQTQGKFKAKSVVRSERFDVVKADWLKDCEMAFRPFQPWDMVFTTPKTLEEFSKRDLDEFSDSYTENATEKSLKFSMGKTIEKNSMEFSMDRISMANLEFEMQGYKMGLFRSMIVYLDNPKKEIFNPLNLLGKSIRFYGGETVCDLDHDQLTHVVMIKEDLSRLEDIKKSRRSRPQGKKFRILTSDYFEQCLKSCKILNSEDHEL